MAGALPDRGPDSGLPQGGREARRCVVQGMFQLSDQEVLWVCNDKELVELVMVQDELAGTLTEIRRRIKNPGKKKVLKAFPMSEIKKALDDLNLGTFLNNLMTLV